MQACLFLVNLQTKNKSFIRASSGTDYGDHGLLALSAARLSGTTARQSPIWNCKVLPAAQCTLPWRDLFELNEAFAAQALACQRELGIDNAKLNVNGGAIAIGHPLGCSGARLATTLIHQMARTGASRGIASLCVGVGQGLATVFERE